MPSGDVLIRTGNRGALGFQDASESMESKWSPTRMALIFSFFPRLMAQKALWGAAAVTAALVSSAGLAVWLVEPEEFDSPFSGICWAGATVTTIGYGDFAPQFCCRPRSRIPTHVLGCCPFRGRHRSRRLNSDPPGSGSGGARARVEGGRDHRAARGCRRSAQPTRANRPRIGGSRRPLESGLSASVLDEL